MITVSGWTSVLDLNDGVNYRLRHDTWSPAVAARRASLLGGRGLYEDVEETMTLDVLGTTPAQALTNLGNLSAALDQADRWSLEENVSPLILSYMPSGSALGHALQTTVLGRYDQQPMVGLSAGFNDVGYLYEIHDVEVRFKRRGSWLDTAETATSTATDAGEILTATFSGNATVSSPVRVGFTSNVPSLPNGAIMLFAKAASKFLLINAKDMAGATAYTSIVATTANARSGNVLRYTPTGTTVAQSNSVAAAFTSKKTAVFATVRNNGSATYQIEFTAVTSVGATVVRTPPAYIDASTTNPRTVFLGYVANPVGALGSYNIRITASATGSSLDIDEIVLMDVDDETSTAVGVIPTALGNVEIAADPQPLTGQRAVVGSPNAVAGTPIVGFASYQGNAFVLSTGSTICGVILAPYASYFRAYNVSSIQFALRATRNRAYQTPI